MLRRILIPLITCLFPLTLPSSAQPTTPDSGYGTLVRQQLTDLPTVYIDTEWKQGIYSKDTWVNATYTEVADGKVVAQYDNLLIRGRGNSTWGLEKNPYRLKFSEGVRLLGPYRAKARNWVFLANHTDKTLIRNALASYIGTLLGHPFTAGTRFVDVVLNDKYIGNYQITDQLDVRRHRVDITEQDDVLDDESDISGGYLIEFDGFWSDAKVSFHTRRSAPVSVRYPDDEHIQWSQIDYIQNFVQRFEDALYSNNHTDPVKGYRAFCDTVSLASLYIASEFTANPDAFWSTYAYKDAGDPLLHWGPMWDYDIAFNNCKRTGDVTRRALIDYAFGGQVILPWMQRIHRDPWFQQLIARTWREASAAGIKQKSLAFVDSLAAVIEQSQRLNFERYSIRQRVYDEIVVFSTYAEGIDYLKRFLADHADYLDTLYPPLDAPDPGPGSEPEPVPDPCFDPERFYALYNVGCGKSVDVAGTEICMWDADPDRLDTQAWQIVPSLTPGYYCILAPLTSHSLPLTSHYAIADMAPASGSSFSTGTTLQLLPFDAYDARQEWQFVPTADHWVIANRHTSLAWNNSGGYSTDGNPVISWTNNADNALKLTRQWSWRDVTELVTGVGSPTLNDADSPDYRVILEPSTRRLLLIQPRGQHLPGTLSVLSLDGRTMATGSVTDPLDLSHLTPGTYIAAWSVAGHRRSARVAL